MANSNGQGIYKAANLGAAVTSIFNPIAGAALSAGISGISSLIDMFRKPEKPETFDYTQTQAYKSAQQETNLAYRQMQEGLPEETMRLQQDMIGRAGAAALGSAGSLRQGVSGIGQTASGLSQSYRQLASMDAQQRIANRGQYYQSLGNLREQEENAANVDYASFVNNQAMRLSQESARADMSSNIQASGLSALGYLGNRNQTPVEYGGLGGQFGQGNGGFGDWFNNTFGQGGKAATQGGTNPFSGTTMDFGTYGNIG